MATESVYDNIFLPRHLWGTKWDDPVSRNERIERGVQDPSCDVGDHEDCGCPGE